MDMHKRVLIVVDPTKDEEQACVTRGVWIAAKLGLGVELLICDYEQFLSGDRVFDSPGLETLRKEVIHSNLLRLEKIARPLQEKGMDVTVSSVWDTPLDDAIIRHVVRTEPALVVKETHYHSKLGRALLGNTDWNLVRYCPEPLWLAKPQAWPADATILASIDPTHIDDEYAELDDQILNPAALIAEKLGLDLHAFHSYVPISTVPVMQIDPRIFPIEGVDEEMQASHQEKVDRLLEGYPVEPTNVHVMTGGPTRLLPQLAKDVNAGLVVMGSIARNALQRVFIGSTTEKVLDNLPCDLLVVKPLWFECPVPPKSPKHFEGTPATPVIQADVRPVSDTTSEPPPVWIP